MVQYDDESDSVEEDSPLQYQVAEMVAVPGFKASTVHPLSEKDGLFVISFFAIRTTDSSEIL